MNILVYLFIPLLILLGIIFACFNAEPVILNYYLGSIKFPLSALLIFALVIGVFLGLLAGLIIYIRLRSTSVRLRRRLKSVEEELSNLRALPLKENH